MCTATLKDEFSRRNFALRFHKFEAFCEAQWRWPKPVFVLYRLLMSAYSLFAFIHMAVSLDRSDTRHHFMVFLTNWTYLVETLFFFWGAVLAVSFVCWPRVCHGRNHSQRVIFFKDDSVDIERQAKTGIDNPVCDDNKTTTTSQKVSSGMSKERVQPSSGPVADGSTVLVPMASLPWYVQVYWVLGNIIQVMALVVTVIYFGALYSASEGITLIDLNVHGISSVMIVIDVIVSARPVRLMHALYPILYGIAYVIFSVIYWSQDHENNVLYENVLDWNHPGPTSGVVVGLGVVGIPFLQLVHYGVYRLRLWCHHRIYGEKYL